MDNKVKIRVAAKDLLPGDAFRSFGFYERIYKTKVVDSGHVEVTYGAGTDTKIEGKQHYGRKTKTVSFAPDLKISIFRWMDS